MSLVQNSSLVMNGSVAVLALAAGVGFEKYYNKNMIEDGESEIKTMQLKKRVKLGLFGFAALVLVPLVLKLLSNKTASSSFDARVGQASSNIRSSANHYPPRAHDDFSARVSAAAKRLREQIADSSCSMRTPPSSSMCGIPPESASSLAAQASAEISKFISENS